MSDKTILETIKELRDAGLDAWDSIPDPEAYLREIRGCRQAEIDVLRAENPPPTPAPSVAPWAGRSVGEQPMETQG